MNKFLKFIFFTFFLLLSNKLLANLNNICDSFYENIRNKNSELELYANPIFEQEEAKFGVLYNQSYDVDKNEWIYKRDKNNNISVFNTNYYSNSYNKLLSGDKIVYLNNLKVSDLSDPEIDEIIANNNNINFKINRKNKDKIETFNYSIENQFLIKSLMSPSI